MNVGHVKRVRRKFEEIDPDYHAGEMNMEEGKMRRYEKEAAKLLGVKVEAGMLKFGGSVYDSDWFAAVPFRRGVDKSTLIVHTELEEAGCGMTNKVFCNMMHCLICEVENG